MPRNFAIVITLLGLVSMGVWYSGTSTAGDKLSVLQRHAHDTGPRRTAKLSGPLTLRIDLRSPLPTAVGDTYKVVAVVLSEQNLSSVKLKWLLGPSVEIISGTTETTVQLKAGEEQEVELTLRAKRLGAQRIQVRAISNDQSSRFAISAHFNSQPAERNLVNKKDLATPAAENQTEQKLFY